MRRETELLFDSIVREDRNVMDLLTADYTFVDERLAKHYQDSEHRRESLPPHQQWIRITAKVCSARAAF